MNARVSRSRGAERARRYRQRRLEGRVVLPVEVDEEAWFEVLVALDLISPESDNDKIIAAASSVAMERLIFSVTRNAARASASRRIKK